MNAAISQSDISAIILAGGKSSRMGGKDKGLLSFRGKSMIEWLISTIQPQVGSIIVSANQNLQQYSDLGVQVVPDTLSDFQGPLAGIAAGLSLATTKYVLVVPVDTPILPANLVEQLSNELINANVDLAVVQVEGKLQPVHLLIKSSLATKLNDYLQSGQRRMQEWVMNQSKVIVSFSSAGNHFRNLNSEADLLEAESNTS